MKIIKILFLVLTLSSSAQEALLSLQDIFLSSKFRTQHFPETKFISQGDSYVMLKNKTLYTFETKSEKIQDSLVLKLDSLPIIEDFEYLEGAHKVIFQYDKEQVYRRSMLCRAVVYDLGNHKSVAIDSDKISNPTISPDFKKISYVKNNNLYLYDIESHKSAQLTFDGSKNKIINGQCDWVYEEEFSFSKAFWWNPEGTKIAYLKFDESEVKLYSLQYWLKGSYPVEYQYKYPKAGESTSKISLWMYDLKTQKHDSLVGVEQSHLPRVGWVDEKTVFYYVLNRLQNHLEIYKCNGETKRLIYEEHSETYLDLDEELHYDQNALYFTSEKSGFRHIYGLNFKTNKLSTITKGQWDVVAIEAINKEALYYTHTKLGTQYHNLSKYVLKSKSILDFKTLSSSKLVHNSEKYAVVSFSSISTPPTYALVDHNFSIIKNYDYNKDLALQLSKLQKDTVNFEQFKFKDYSVNAFVITPIKVNNDSKHPVLIHQYSGPGYQLVVDEWKSSTFLWYKYLISKGYVVVLVDPRGSGGKGRQFKNCTYLQLGLKESEDLALVSQKLSDYAYVDSNRISIFGWSFGGYTAALCATKWSKYFDKAVVVAPVTDWKLYDNIYTERYMQTPALNPIGYDTSSVMKYVKNMNSKMLLIHGTGDDNVHIQNSYLLQNSMLKHNKQFDFHVFADKNHSIYGGNTRLYLYTKITDFLLK